MGYEDYEDLEYDELYHDDDGDITEQKWWWRGHRIGFELNRHCFVIGIGKIENIFTIMLGPLLIGFEKDAWKEG